MSLSSYVRLAHATVLISERLFSVYIGNREITPIFPLLCTKQHVAQIIVIYFTYFCLFEEYV